MSIKDKLEEVKFFLELFDALEQRGQSLTNTNTVEREASFIFSAILNSFYSVTELAKDDGAKKEEVQTFKIAHPLIYAGSGKGGLRNTTVHVKHIVIDHAGYIPPKGNEVNINFKKTPKLVQEKKDKEVGIVLKFTPYFYIEINKEMKRIMAVVENHFSELRKFVASL
jgi:hypothetical protein